MISLPTELQAATFVCLALTVLSLYLGARVWSVMLLIAIALGYVSGVLTSTGAGWIAALGVACFMERKLTTSVLLGVSRIRVVARSLVLLAIICLTVGLGVHALPGFSNPQVADDLQLTAGAAPYDLYLNFDKTAAGIVILGVLCSHLLTGTALLRALAIAAPIIIVNVMVLLALSLAFGYVRFEPKWTAFFWLWAAVNLLFTCVTEEVFFRGVLQHRLQAALGHVRAGKWIALAVASTLFGLAHFGGGWTYVLLASVAGAGYGYALQRTGRIEAAILAHFLLNAGHFLLFTYPRLEP